MGSPTGIPWALLELNAAADGISHTYARAAMDIEKLKRMASAVRTGGRESVRRKKKAVHKTTTTDDKRLQVSESGHPSTSYYCSCIVCAYSKAPYTLSAQIDRVNCDTRR